VVFTSDGGPYEQGNHDQGLVMGPVLQYYPAAKGGGVAREWVARHPDQGLPVKKYYFPDGSLWGER
jgi:hypothetical protein